MIVFLLNKDVKILNVPWKLGIIDNCLKPGIADYIRDNFPETKNTILKDFYQHAGPAKLNDRIFYDFFLENWTRRDELHLKAHEILNIPTPEDSVLSRWNYTYFPAGNPKEVVRDWHTDLEDKKLQFILYLGHNSRHTTFQTEGIQMPFVHNRLIFWHATPYTPHRFFYCKTKRCTVNLTSQMNDSPTNFNGLEDYI